MANIRTIADKTGVSTATVSRALNNDPEISEKTRQKVLACANKLGYSASVGRRTQTLVGLAYACDIHLENSNFDATLLGGIVKGLHAKKMDVAIIDIHRDKQDNENYTQFFMRKGIRGVILRTSMQHRQVSIDIADEKFPSITVAECFEEPHVNYLVADSNSGTRQAIEHLIQLGHKRIAFAMMIDPDHDHSERYQAYRTVLAEHGIEYDPKLAFKIIPTLNGGAQVISHAMLLPQPPTAIFFADPPAMIGAIQRCHEINLKVPDELSIAGFDDSTIRQYAHPLPTVVWQDAASLGQKAAIWLCNTLADPKQAQPCRERMSTILEINQTTAPPPITPTGTILPSGQRTDS